MEDGDGGYRIPFFITWRRIDDPFCVERRTYYLHLHPRGLFAEPLRWAALRLADVSYVPGQPSLLYGLALRLGWAAIWLRNGYPGPFRAWRAAIDSHVPAPEHEMERA
jgi:hypothetical protein